MDGWCVLLISGLGALVAGYLLLELHYFVRMALCVCGARLFGKRLYILDQTAYTGICLTTDLDTLLYHMNNARYLREIDFARVDFYERTHLYRTIVAHGGAVVQGASTIRYRRFIRPFRTYRIQSRIIYWDEQSIFMEHRFVSPRDGFVHCVALCRQRLIDCSAIDVMAELLQLRPQRAMPAAVALGGGEKSHSVAPAMTNGTTPTTIVVSTTAANAAADVSIAAATTSTISESCGKSLRPELPADVAKWIEYNELSSASLRQDC